MKLKPIVAAVSAALGVTVLSSAACAGSTVKSVEFIGMDAPASVDEKSDVYTKAQVIYRYTNGKSKTYDLKYHQVTGTTELVNGKLVGGLYDRNDAPLEDDDGPMASARRTAPRCSTSPA